MGEKFRFASNEDANQFFFKEKFRSASKEDVDQFYFKKNLDLHLRKMQIRFLVLIKRVDYMQIIEIKKEIITII